MARPITYYVARLNLLGSFDSYEQKSQILIDALQQDNAYEYYRHLYTFFDIEILSDNDFGQIVTGLLVKFKPTELEEQVDLDNKEFTFDPVENKTMAKVRFFLHPKTGLMAHHAASKLKKGQFRRRFADLLNDTTNNFFFEAKVEVVTRRFEFFQELEELRSISKISIELHPSNPNYDPIWESIDEHFKEQGIATYKEEREARVSESLKIEGDGELKSKLTMADDGYGVGEAEGFDHNGERKEISTADKPYEKVAPSEDEADPPTILGSLKDLLLGVRKRFNNDE